MPIGPVPLGSRLRVTQMSCEDIVHDKILRGRAYVVAHRARLMRTVRASRACHDTRVVRRDA